MGVKKHVRDSNSENGNFMHTVKTYNKIAKKGIDLLENAGFLVSSEVSSPQAIILRSHVLSEGAIPNSVFAIGRAGSGCNNIPVQVCTDRSIVVFNAPGANANAVKELVLGAMLMASRNLKEALLFSEKLIEMSVQDENIDSFIESNKAQFKGGELQGKTLGVIGLGAIGVMVANAADQLGMKVLGYDPFISVRRAWGVSSSVQSVTNLSILLSRSDYVSLHMPLTDKTEGFMNKERLGALKKGSILLNFSRKAIVDEDAIFDILNKENSSIFKYVMDFPSKKLLGVKNVISMPHLGASTLEAETNCSVMVADQLIEYILSGNIRNSVNFSDCVLDATLQDNRSRLAIFNKNVPAVLSKITSVIADANFNILDMVNTSKGEGAYSLFDLESDKVSLGDVVSKISNIDGIKFVRVLP